MKTKLFTLFLTLVASVGAMFAWDYERVQIGELYYNLDATNQTAEATFQLEWSENNYSELTTANIPSSVTYNNATYSVTSIGEFSFNNCSSLASVTIPNSVTSIGNQAFSGCTGLTSITIPNSVTSIGDGAFTWCVGLTSVTIPNNVTSIGRTVFKYCHGLTSITIPNSVTSIGKEAFYECVSLTSVTIPNSVTTIGDWTFAFCISLTSVTIPNSVTSIGGDAFLEVLNVVYSGSATGAPWGAKYFNGYVDGYLVYSDETKTTLVACATAARGEIIIPNSVTSIENYAFSGCYDLTSIVIESGNTVYDSRNNCNAIIETATNTLIAGCQNTIIPNSVTSIGERAFSGCTGLTSITIPNSVTSIGIRAFAYCSSLTSVTIPNSVTSIGGDAFLEVLNVVYSGSATGAPWGAKCFNGYVDGYLVYSDETKTTLIACATAAQGKIIIPNSVTSIGDQAFYDCSRLTSVIIGNSVTSIGISAFAWCISLTSITIGYSVTSIGNYAFERCSGLASVIIPNSVGWIGERAFSYCYGLTSITCEAVNPPYLKSKVFYSVDNTIPLYVPTESINTYKSTDQWKDFLNILPISSQGIEELFENIPQDGKFLRNGQIFILRGEKVYTLQGQEVR